MLTPRPRTAPSDRWQAVAGALARRHGAGTRVHAAAIQAQRSGPAGVEGADLFLRAFLTLPRAVRDAVLADLAGDGITLPDRAEAGGATGSPAP